MQIVGDAHAQLLSKMNVGVAQGRILAEGQSDHICEEAGNLQSLQRAQESNQMEISSKLGVSYNPLCANVRSRSDVEKASVFSQEYTIKGGDHGRSQCIGLDLNVALASLLDCEDPLPYMNNNDYSKSMELSECGSTTGSLEEKEPISVWKGMKENSFISNTYNRLPPPVPNRRGRKTKSEMMQKKLEMAKRERVDRFARIAAPSGLFRELNPGIINHVRNSKQVHSIIEALVKSESIETANVSIKPAGKMKSFSNEKMMEPLCFECGSTRNRHARGCSMENVPVSLGLKEERFEFCSSQTDSKIRYKTSQSTHGRKDNILPLKLSSSSTAYSSEGISLLSSSVDDVAGVSVLSLKAATVASQWLNLLHQDAKGRLAALRRSRKRARSVIETDLPSLLAKDFLPTISDDTSTLVSKSLKNDVAELHQTRWSSLFSLMEMALSQEEKQLEGWIFQVKEMQLQCERGLHNMPWNSSFCPQKLRTPGDSWRAESTSNEKGSAVTAAAASIYSTCSFLLNKDQENT